MIAPLGTRILAVAVLSVSIGACGIAEQSTLPEKSALPDEEDSNDRVTEAETDVVVGCTSEDLSDGDEEFTFTSAFPVVGGELGPACLGGDDPIVLVAWDILEAITPPDQLSDLGLFSGYEPEGGDAAEMLAFVVALDADGTAFQMSLNIVESEADSEELTLTMAHEFSHVFTATPSQLDRTDEAIDDCDTHFNGEGCYLPDSLMLAWIEAFWEDDELATLDPGVDDPDGAEQRCAIDDGYFGSYAPISPEEDFAEAFSAYVFGLGPATDGQADRLDWMAQQPGLAEFRDRADEAGLSPLENRFDLCGS